MQVEGAVRDIKEVVSRSANVDALNFWGAFGFLVHQELRAAGQKLCLAESSDFVVHRCYAVGPIALANPVSLQLFSRPVVQLDRSKPTGVALNYVRPASLTFSIGVDGGVLALAWPFSAEGEASADLAHGKSAAPYVVGVLPRPQQVTKQWIRVCLKRFIALAVACHPSTTPTARTQRLLNDTIGRHNRLTGKPAQPSQAESYEVAWAALLVSLVAVGVTLAQLAEDYPYATALGFAATTLGFVALGWLVVRRLRVFPH